MYYLLYRLKNKTGYCCSYKTCSLGKHKDNQMKFQWKMQEKWKKVTAGVQESQENEPYCWAYTLEEIPNNFRRYILLKNNPFPNSCHLEIIFCSIKYKFNKGTL